ncbi:hypothetical protein K5X82_04090 [Halosquirtibacter xylanolyticus]|uniref:hypothetical protein n=1 Tax=Halosquirtibacter xylanolyticus TaxID=3374599 RepID=UPI003747BAF7|nr:hypothetical protein K5X82_04090 [Prolixibacteraceae bacterium]
MFDFFKKKKSNSCCSVKIKEITDNKPKSSCCDIKFEEVDEKNKKGQDDCSTKS